LVNNHVFFQHPDLIRILRIHENVIAIMMTSISRASQDRDGGGTAAVGEQQGQGGGGEQQAWSAGVEEVM